MLNKTFYYRFKKEDGQTAVGQLRFTELKALLCNIRINNDTESVMGIYNPISAKAIIAPSMKIIDLNETPINIFATFENAVKQCNPIFRKGCNNYVDYNELDLFGTHLQDIWDVLNDKVEIQRRYACGMDWFIKPFTYKWDGTQPYRKYLDNQIAYDFITGTCFLTDENFSFDGCYHSKEECQKNNAVQCYTFPN